MDNIDKIVGKFDDTRYSEVIRGRSGEGKTTLASLQVGRLAKLTGRNVYLFIPKAKRFETVPKYLKWVPSEQLRVETMLQISEGFLGNRRGSIFVVEDLGFYDEKNKTPANARKLVVALARAYDIFTVVVTQSRQLLGAPLTIDVMKPRYEIREGIHSFETYTFASDSQESVDPLIGAVFDGLRDKDIGIVGRRVLGDSIRQRVIRAVDAGMTTRQIVAAFPNEKRKTIYEYVAQKRDIDKKKVATLRDVDENLLLDVAQVEVEEEIAHESK